MILGYINEGGYLVTKEVSTQTERYRDSEGKEQVRTISEEAQAERLIENGYKPVEDLDETRTQCAPGFCVRILPIDNGSSISFNYVTVKDMLYYNRTIDLLKKQLEASDYKVTKCYEAMMAGEPAPYDVQQLHAERQALRVRINSLEAERDND